MFVVTLKRAIFGGDRIASMIPFFFSRHFFSLSFRQLSRSRPPQFQLMETVWPTAEYNLVFSYQQQIVDKVLSMCHAHAAMANKSNSIPYNFQDAVKR